MYIKYINSVDHLLKYCTLKFNFELTKVYFGTNTCRILMRKHFLIHNDITC